MKENTPEGLNDFVLDRLQVFEPQMAQVGD